MSSVQCVLLTVVVLMVHVVAQKDFSSSANTHVLFVSIIGVLSCYKLSIDGKREIEKSHSELLRRQNGGRDSSTTCGVHRNTIQLIFAASQTQITVIYRVRFVTQLSAKKKFSVFADGLAWRLKVHGMLIQISSFKFTRLIYARGRCEVVNCLMRTVIKDGV